MPPSTSPPPIWRNLPADRRRRLAVLIGRVLLRVVPLHSLHYVGATVCLLLAAFTAYELVA